MERQSQGIERKNKRLTAALTVMAVAMCVVVTMAATGEKDGDFDVVTARQIWVENDANEYVVSLSATDGGHGLVLTRSAWGKELVELGATKDGEGTVSMYAPNGKELVSLGASSV